jgi:hypothetical protein
LYSPVDRITTSSYQEEPYSLSEFAVGTVAVTAVAVIAFLGIVVPQPPQLLPAILSKADPSSVTPPNTSAKVSRWRRHTPAAMAPAQPSLRPRVVQVTAVHKADSSESLDANSAASKSRAADPGRTKELMASDFLEEADPAAIVRLLSPEIAGLPAPLIGSPDLFQMNDAMSIQVFKPARKVAIVLAGEKAAIPSSSKDAAIPSRSEEAAVPSPPGAERDPSNRSDALWIQTKLRDLGYYAGNANGVWGPASRSALHDFKTMNGLQEDDKWDKETEQRLLSKQSVRASSTFIGSWAKDAEGCQRVRSGTPLVIRSGGAESSEGGKCDFRSVKREAATMWRIQAACSADKQAWTANISLKLTGSNLNWSSERGTETYVRCSKL